jgi:predicted small secreted protein
MNVSDVWDIFGGVLVLALVATILTKPNTAKDVQAAGSAFSGAIKQAQAG